MDGYIKIGTEIDTSNFDKDYKKIEKRLKELEKKATKPYEIDGTMISGGWNLTEDEQEEYNMLQRDLEKINQELRDMNNIDEMITENKKQQTKELEKQLKIGSEINGQEIVPNEETIKISELNQLLREYNEIQAAPIYSDDDLIRLGEIEQHVKEIVVELEKMTGKKFHVDGITDLSEEIKEVKGNIGNIDLGLTKLIKKVGKWALAVFSVRSAYMFVRQSVSTLSRYNDQLATDIEYIHFAIAKVLEPVIKAIVKFVYMLLNTINMISKTLFGIDLFANATANAFEKAKKGAAALKKTLLGFDEMNILNDNGTIGTAPSYDLSKELGNFNLIDWISNINWKNVLIKIGDIIDKVFTYFEKVIEKTDWTQLGTNIGNFLLNVDWEKLIRQFIHNFGVSMSILPKIAWGMIKGYFQDLWRQVEENAATNGTSVGWEFLKGIAKGVWNNITLIPKTIWNEYIQPKIDEIKNKFKTKGEESGGNFVNGIIDGIISVLGLGFVKKVWEKLNPKLNELKTKSGDSGKSAGTSFLNSFIAAIPVLSFTNHIQKIIDGIKKKLTGNFSIAVGFAGGSGGGSVFAKGGIYYPNKPIKLASGAIINQPGRGVPLGRAIGGEEGHEGILPLTDSQQMDLLGQAIAKHMVINLTNVTEIDGRPIARYVNKINANSDFAYNR